MKKLICLLAVLALAATAIAEIDVITGGTIQSPWMPAQSVTNQTFGGSPAVRWRNNAGGWMSVATNSTVWDPPPAVTPLAGNQYIEFDMYFDCSGTRKGRTFDCMHLQINADTGWTYKWEGGIGNAGIWVDDVKVDLSSWSADPNTWVHIKLDLLTNSQPQSPPPNPLRIDLDNDKVGAIRFYYTSSNGTLAYTREMQFTPEPATIALLGLGGLALVRRKR